MSSQQYRELGNQSYKDAGDDLAPAIQIGRLQKAINLYEQAINRGTNAHEWSSAYKNSAMANYKMAGAESRRNSENSMCLFYFKTALRQFQRAAEHGEQREGSWRDSLAASAERCWEDIISHLDPKAFDDRVRQLNTLIPLCFDDNTKATEYYNLADKYFHESLRALTDRDFKTCLRLLAETHFPLNEAKRFGSKDLVIFSGACRILEEDIFIQKAVAQSIQARVKGEELLQRVTQDEEDLNMDIVWDVVDWFTQAAQLTRNQDLELEAMAYSALGKMYDQVLKMKDKAKAYLTKVVELVNSMVPRNFSGCDWYDFARLTLEKYQQEKVKEEEEEMKKDRVGILKELAAEIGLLAINFSNMGKLEFLSFVYATHPPKNPAHKLAEVSTPEPDELKKLYQKAVVHYHPDKVRVDEHGMNWKVLSEEITKLLTKGYEFYKECC